MPKLQPNQNHSQQLKYPAKRVAFNGQPVDFVPEYDDNGDRSNGLLWYPYRYDPPEGQRRELERYPSIYSNGGGGLFTKAHNVVVNDYFENNRFVSGQEAWLYIYLMNMRSRGYRVSIHGKKQRFDKQGREVDPGTAGLAAIHRQSARTMMGQLDRLENALLMHRITRLDWKGAPNEYVIHTPFDVISDPDAPRDKPRSIFPPDKAALIERRIKDNVSKQRRLAASKNDTGRGRSHDIKQYKESPAAFIFQYDHRDTEEAFGDRTVDFTEFALIFFRENLKTLNTRKGDFQKKYRDRLAIEMDQWSVESDKRYGPRWRLRNKDHKEICFKAANKFRTIYCPTLEELCQI